MREFISLVLGSFLGVMVLLAIAQSTPEISKGYCEANNNGKPCELVIESRYQPVKYRGCSNDQQS